MTREIDYRRAFKIACDLLNGDILYGVDSDEIFKTMMDRDGVVTKDSYEEYILNHLQELDHGEYAIKALEQEPVLDKIRAEILDCLKALDEIEKLGLNIYLPNEMSGRRLTYQQCLEFIDKYRAKSEE